MRNELVNDINLKTLSKILGEEGMYKSIDSIADADECINFHTEFSNSM